MATFLVFTRSDRHPWGMEFPMTGLAAAVDAARACVKSTDPEVQADRAVVMEVGGTDAIPTFTYRFGVKAS